MTEARAALSCWRIMYHQGNREASWLRQHKCLQLCLLLLMTYILLFPRPQNIRKKRQNRVLIWLQGKINHQALSYRVIYASLTTIITSSPWLIFNLFQANSKIIIKRVDTALMRPLPNEVVQISGILRIHQTMQLGANTQQSQTAISRSPQPLLRATPTQLRRHSYLKALVMLWKTRAGLARHLADIRVTQRQDRRLSVAFLEITEVQFLFPK